MDLRQLKCFICVADMGGFSRAADVLGTAQSAVSRHVALLEAEFGQRLFDRHGRGVRLNEAGKRLYAHGRGILEQVSRAKQDVLDLRNVPVGKLILGLPYSVSRVFSAPFVRAFTKAFPQAQLAITEGSSDHILEWLALGQLDLGLVFNPGHAPGIQTTRLVQDKLCLITTKKNPLIALRSNRPVLLRDVVKHPIIVPRSSHTLRKCLDEHLSRAGLELNIRLEMDSIPTIVDLIRNREGVAILPGSVAFAYSNKNDLLAYPVTQPRLPFSLHMAIHDTRPVTILARQVAAQIQALVPKLVLTDVDS
jgi:LysR family nitrogen assimilation transcriptional regulator